MTTLQDRLTQLLPVWQNDVKSFLSEHGDDVISKVTLSQAYGGMRGVRALVCETSLVEPDTGLVIRGIPVKKLVDRLPEEILWLLLTSEFPDEHQLQWLQSDLKKRARVPDYVWAVLEAMPRDSHPMCMLNTAILCMGRESVFHRHYDEGLTKDHYWGETLDDALNLIARLPAVAAGIYRLRFGKGPRILSSPKLDWGADFAYMLGIDDPDGSFAKLMRLYLVLHSDHESGNVSANAAATVNSALSDLYYALSAGLNGLAGPLHGLANQECLAWVLQTKERFGGVPTREQLEKYAWETLEAGHVVPGYGHAVLRITDPRFDAFLDFGKKHCPDDEVFQIVARVFEVVPNVLKQVKKIKDPWPNVDAASGALLWKYGLTELSYYTVLFSVSRALGICAQAVIARGMGYPIVRPKSSTTEWLKKQLMRTPVPA